MRALPEAPQINPAAGLPLLPMIWDARMVVARTPHDLLNHTLHTFYAQRMYIINKII